MASTRKEFDTAAKEINLAGMMGNATKYADDLNMTISDFMDSRDVKIYHMTYAISRYLHELFDTIKLRELDIVIDIERISSDNAVAGLCTDIPLVQIVANSISEVSSLVQEGCDRYIKNRAV